MPYPRQSDDLKKRGIGISLDGLTIRRIDALHDGTGRRSDFLRSVVLAGLVQLYGPEWESLADARMDTEAVA